MDLPLDELRRYRPELAEPADFDAFWAQTLAETRGYDLGVTVTPVQTGLAVVDTFDVRFAGFGGAPIAGWLHLPAHLTGPLPAVVEYIGYGGGRGLPTDRFLWAAAGYAHLVMDTRGQGSGWAVGSTPDPDAGLSGPAYPGFMTRGIEDPLRYYYRRVYADAVRAVEAARTLSTVDPERVAVTGSSQGGGIALAVAGLVRGLVAVAPDVPFLANFPRGVTVADEGPYPEIVGYLKAHRDRVDTVFGTLAYFDVALHARRATAPALFSVALMDATCPASTVYTAFHNYAGGKEIVDYPFNDHEGGQAFHDREKIRFFAGLLGG